MVYSIYDSTEVAIQKMIDASQRMISEQHNSSVVKRDFKLKIKTLENAPRDPDKLQRLLQSKEQEKHEARHTNDIERLVTEIEMLKVVLYLVNRNNIEEAKRDSSKKEEKYGNLLFLFFCFQFFST